MGKVVFRLTPGYKDVLGVQTFPAARQLSKRIFDLAVARSPSAGDAREWSGHNDGGPLRDANYHVEVLWPGNGWRLRVGNRKSYAWYVHQGTKAHDIPGDPILRFFWPKAPSSMGGPGIYFFKTVHHPGTKPQPWLWSSTVAILAANSFQSLGGIIA